MYILNTRLAADVFDGEYIIANLDTGLYYSIQGIAVSLINALPFPDQNMVISELKQHFPEHESEIEVTLSSIMNELLAEEIILSKDFDSIQSAEPIDLPKNYIAGRFNRYADMQDLLLLDPIHDVDENGWMVQNPDTSTEMK